MSTFEEILHATVTADQRKEFARTGVAMPGGRYYIRNASDLDNAIRAIGRAGGPEGTEKDRNAARRHCIARAKALGLLDKIPDTWNADGTLKHSDIIDGIIAAVLPNKKDAKQEGVTMANTTAAIMALPAPLENIRLVGDEDKHATLLFFGETNSLPDGSKDVLIESVKMACSMLFPFSERVRDISRLGNDVPPALVAMLSDENLTPVRNLFLMNPDVKGYLTNAQQWPSFTSHVTLGHPDYTEEAILRTLASQLFRVRFDRLAVWWNDERIECPLNQIVEGDSMAMSDAVDNFMEHHGVKGQKWGVRRSDTLGVSPLAAKGRVVVTRPSKSGEASGAKPSVRQQSKVAFATHNIAKKLSDATESQKTWDDIGTEIVAKTGNGKSLTAKNMVAVNSIVAKHLTQAAQQHAEAGTTARVMALHSLNVKMNPQLKPALFLIVGKNKSDVDAYVDDTKSRLNAGGTGNDPQKDWIVHALPDSGVDVLELQPLIDDQGFITGIKDPDFAHSVLDEVLEHSGIKGMKWGVRRRVDPKSGLVQRTSSADQIHVDRIAKKLHSGGVSALSNKDLQEFSTRIQREQEFNRALSSQEAQRSKPFIQRFLATQGKRQFTRVTDKAIDIAVEKALESAGIKVGKKNKDIGDLLTQTGVRLKPKKKGG